MSDGATGHCWDKLVEVKAELATMTLRESAVRSALLMLLEQIDDDTTDSVNNDGERYQSQGFADARRHALGVLGIG